MMTENISAKTTIHHHDQLPLELFRQGVIACLPTILGFWSIGFAAGAIGALAGFSVLDITLLAVFLYAGSAQFMFYSLHAAGAGVLAIVLGVMLINMRYVLMSSYMAIYFTGPVPPEVRQRRSLTDETFGVAAQQGSRTGELPFAWMLGLNVTAAQLDRRQSDGRAAGGLAAGVDHAGSELQPRRHVHRFIADDMVRQPAAAA